jgi:hypothetical protein
MQRFRAQSPRRKKTSSSSSSCCCCYLNKKIHLYLHTRHAVTGLEEKNFFGGLCPIFGAHCTPHWPFFGACDTLPNTYTYPSLISVSTFFRCLLHGNQLQHLVHNRLINMLGQAQVYTTSIHFCLPRHLRSVGSKEIEGGCFRVILKLHFNTYAAWHHH